MKSIKTKLLKKKVGNDKTIIKIALKNKYLLKYTDLFVGNQQTKIVDQNI